MRELENSSHLQAKLVPDEAFLALLEDANTFREACVEDLRAVESVEDCFDSGAEAITSCMCD